MTANPSFSFKLVAQPHGVGGFSHNAREARWNWNQAKCGAGMLLKTALHDIACMCYHFFVARASSWNVGEHTYLSPFSIPLFLLLPPSSSASCRQMILTQLALTKLLMSTLRVCRHERVADWTGPKGTLCIQFCD